VGGGMVKLRAKREYVDCVYRTEGDKIIPLEIIMDKKQYIIDRVLSVDKIAHVEIGGMGVRYTVRIMNKKAYIWYDAEDNQWFVAKKLR
jgi:hypothetical protein